MRFSNSLLLSSRDLDIGVVCAISGSARIIDISGIFRADVEARARLIFHLYANVANPAPIGGTNIEDIQSVPFKLTGAADDRVMTVLNTGEIVWTT